MPDEFAAKSGLVCLGRAALAGSVVLMSALVAEMVLAAAIDIPPQAGLALVTALTLGSALLGLLSLGRLRLYPAVSLSLGVALLLVRASIAGGPASQGAPLGGGSAPAGRAEALAACVLAVLAAYLIGSALGRGLELTRRPWTLCAIACAVQVAIYSIPPLGGAIRAGAFARLALVVPIPEERVMSGGPTAAEASAFGLDPMEAVFLAAFAWRAFGDRAGPRRVAEAVAACAVAAAVFTMGLGFRVPMLPFLAAAFRVLEREPRTAPGDVAPDEAGPSPEPAD